MLNLNCVICAELFAQTDDVHVTVCGHMFHFVCLSQWLERSKTCPQCRSRCSERNIIRLYFNLANLDSSHIDVGSMQEQLDNIKLQLLIKDKELKKAEEEIKSLKDTQKMCKSTITGLESELKKREFVVRSYMEQTKMLKADLKVTEDLRKEVKSLKQQLETAEGVSCLLAASTAEAEKLLKNENDPKKLSIWVITLKRELRNCDSKRTDIRNVLRVVQSDLRREIDCKKKLEERISQLESECYMLNEKLKSNESMPSTSKSAQSQISANISNSKISMVSSPLKESLRKIDQSDSPYLNIKSSSVGLMPYPFKRLQETASTASASAAKDVNAVRHTTTKLTTLKVSPKKSTTEAGNLRKFSSDVTEKYSIFKKPRLGLSTGNTLSGTSSKAGTVKRSSSNFVFNGFGGSERINPFEINSDDDDDMEIVNEYPIENQVKELRLGNSKKNKIETKDGGKRTGLKNTNSASGATLSDRLKSGGLRNFMVSNKTTSDRSGLRQLKTADPKTGSNPHAS